MQNKYKMSHEKTMSKGHECQDARTLTFLKGVMNKEDQSREKFSRTKFDLIRARDPIVDNEGADVHYCDKNKHKLKFDSSDSDNETFAPEKYREIQNKLKGDVAMMGQLQIKQQKLQQKLHELKRTIGPPVPQEFAMTNTGFLSNTQTELNDRNTAIGEVRANSKYHRSNSMMSTALILPLTSHAIKYDEAHPKIPVQGPAALHNPPRSTVLLAGMGFRSHCTESVMDTIRRHQDMHK